MVGPCCYAYKLIRTVQLSGCSESLDSMIADALLLIFLPLLPTYEESKEIANQADYINSVTT